MKRLFITVIFINIVIFSSSFTTFSLEVCSKNFEYQLEDNVTKKSEVSQQNLKISSTDIENDKDKGNDKYNKVTSDEAVHYQSKCEQSEFIAGSSEALYWGGVMCFMAVVFAIYGFPK